MYKHWYNSNYSLFVIFWATIAGIPVNYSAVPDVLWFPSHCQPINSPGIVTVCPIILCASWTIDAWFIFASGHSSLMACCQYCLSTEHWWTEEAPSPITGAVVACRGWTTCLQAWENAEYIDYMYLGKIGQAPTHIYIIIFLILLLTWIVENRCIESQK